MTGPTNHARDEDIDAVFGRDRNRVYINSGAQAALPEIDDPSVWPYPAPLILDEAEHRAERVVYESFLRAGGAPDSSIACYSVTLPLGANSRTEIDFLAIGANGVAIVEVKGGIVHVDSVPGQSAMWRQTTRAGRAIDKGVKPAQLFRATDQLKGEIAKSVGIRIHNFAQLLVFPDTSMRDVADMRLHAALAAPDRDFPRVVFAEELQAKGMWRILGEEMAMPGRSVALDAGAREALALWANANIRAQPREPEFETHRPAAAPAVPLEPLRAWPVLPTLPPEVPPARRGSAFFRNWPQRLGIAIAVAAAIAWWGGREAPKAPVPTPSVIPMPSPAAVPAAGAAAPAPAPARAAPPAAPADAKRPDVIQAALTQAEARPNERIQAGGRDWVRMLGPIAGRPGCQFAEIAKGGPPVNVIACRSAGGVWSW